jgi:hypothetical protein
MGSGIGSVPVDRMVKSIDEFMKATIPGGFKIETKTFPLSEVEKVWDTADNVPRIVFEIA